MTISVAGGIFHYGRIENQFLSSGLAGATQSGRNGRAAGPHDRLRRVHHNRRREPIGCESRIHLLGASRPEGIRPVIPLSFGSANSAQPDCHPTGFRVPLESLALPEATGTKSFSPYFYPTVP